MKLLAALALLIVQAQAINHELHGWQATAPPAASKPLKLHLALTSTTTPELHELFEAVADPTSSSYGKFLTRAELKVYCLQGVSTSAPAVEQWLSANKVSFKRSGCGDTLELAPTVAQAEALFGVTMFTFSHTDSSIKIIRTLNSLTFPSSVAPHIVFVSGLFNFPHVKKSRVNDASLGASSAVLLGAPQVTPSLLKKLYGLGDAKFSGKSNASQAVVEFQGQLIVDSDLTAFESKNNLPKQSIRTCTGDATHRT